MTNEIDELNKLRHSTTHVMAQAVQELFPGTKITIGPPIDDGFYYDFDFGETEVKEENLKEIEKKMKNIIKQNQMFEYSPLPVDEAINFLKASGEIYKIEMAEDLKTK